MIDKTKKWFAMSLFNHRQVLGFFEPLIQVFLPNYMANKYRARILKLRNENSEVYSLVLKVNKNWKGFKSGQHVELVVEKNGTKLSRIFSISSSPQLFKSKRVIELSIQRQLKGRITEWLPSAVKTGQYVNISAAIGDFTIDNSNKPVLLIAAGTGITPFRSILANNANDRDIHLLYYAKPEKHLFISELKSIQSLHSNVSITFINSTINGRISENHLSQYCPDFNNRQCYICGPSEMIQSTKNLLLSKGLSNQNIYFEYFGSAPIKDIGIETSGTVSFFKSSIQVLTKNKNKQSLLEMAESADLKPITGCRMGLCHQCVCEKKQGTVYNTLTKTFSDTGKEDVQLCICVPVGDVSINL